MTTIRAEVIADSVSPAGVRLTTLQLRYPRWIHPEMLTHRVFSRSSSSSRAVPVRRLIDDVRRDPAMPLAWTRDEPGMQGRQSLDSEQEARARALMASACESALRAAQALSEAGCHKQIVNRVLEPFAHINVLVSSTRWANFFALRRHADAEPHLHRLADEIFKAMRASTPSPVARGDWHLPYVRDEDHAAIGARLGPGHTAHDDDWQQLAIRVSVARCARVSYLTHEAARPTLEADLKLYERLVGAEPLHASPAEHQATPDPGHYRELWGNFHGWLQFRKSLPGEAIDEAAGLR